MKNNLLQKKIPDGWRIFTMKEVILENKKSTLKVGGAKLGEAYPFFTSGEKILSYEQPLVSGENIYMSTGGTARVKYFNGDASYSADTYSFKIKENTVYFYYVILDKINGININLFSGTGLKHLQKNDFKDLSILAPGIKEQEEIAKILKTVDEEIQKVEKIIFLSEDLKKGLMKNMFKSEGLVLLDTVAKRGSGHTPNKQHLEYWDGGIKWVSLTDSSKLDNRYIYETDKEISMIGIRKSSAVLHPKNTVIICRDAGIGKTAILSADNMAVSQHFIAWQCNEGLNFKYLYYWLQSQKNVFEQIATGTTIKTIGLPFFKKLQIPLLNISDQEKIADLFWEIDEKILINQKLKKKFLELRKGLMADLLSGKVRVIK